MLPAQNGRAKPAALALLSSERPRNVGWLQAAAGERNVVPFHMPTELADGLGPESAPAFP